MAVTISIEAESRPYELYLQLFGGFSAQRGDQSPPPSCRSRKGQWLLCLLALRGDRPTDRTWLAETLWPDSDNEQALFNLRRNLSDLRHVIGPNHASVLLTPTPRTLCLSSENCFCDVRAFDRAAEAKSDEGLLIAAALYIGPLLPECDEEWVLAERESREEKMASVLSRIAERHAAAQEWREAAAVLRRALRMSPLREPALRALLSALSALGDTSGMTKAYDSFRAQLQRDLGSEVNPDDETIALYTSLRQRGVAPKARTEPAVPAAMRSGASLLPRPLTPLIGRESDREEIVSAIRESRLVTLLGGGGSGKTRLAISVAGLLKNDPLFEDGAHFIDLTSLIVPDVLAPTIANALLGENAAGAAQTLSAQGGVPSTLLIALRSRRLLLVLDNCEHLVAEAAKIVQTLLSNCPGVYILITSRQSLGVPGELIRHVTPLPPDFAARLFVERARAASGGRFLPGIDDPRVLQICELVEGIPLALEMASAWTDVLALGEIVTRLKTNLRLLLPASESEARQRQSQPQRRRTLDTVLDGSYRLLDGPEARLACELSLFSGGWTLHHAARVAGLEPEEALGQIARLIDKSTIRREDAASDAGETRYGMLAMVGQYLRDRFTRESGADAVYDARRRHRDTFLELAEAAWPHLSGGQAQILWIGRVAAELGNIRSALLFCREQRESGIAEGAETGLRLAAAMGPFWNVRGFFFEALGWLEEMIAANAGADSQAYAEACRQSVGIATLLGDMKTAMSHAEAAVQCYRRREDVSGEASTLVRLGDIQTHLGRYDAAAAIFAEALALQQSIDDRAGEASTRAQWAYLAREQGQFDVAMEHLKAALQLNRDAGDRTGEASILGAMGAQLGLQGQDEAAESHLRQALGLYREIGIRTGESWTLASLAGLARDSGRLDEARELVSKALEINEEIGSRAAVAWNLTTLADLQRLNDDLSEARRSIERALKTAREAGSYNHEPWIYLTFSEIARESGQTEESYAHARSALRGASDLRNTLLQAEVLERIALGLWQEARPASAAKIWGAAAAERVRLKTPLSHLRTASLTGRVAAETEYPSAWASGETAEFPDIVALALTEIDGFAPVAAQGVLTANV